MCVGLKRSDDDGSDPLCNRRRGRPWWNGRRVQGDPGSGGRLCAQAAMPWEGCDERLGREADVLAQFDNPHLMGILDQGTDVLDFTGTQCHWQWADWTHFGSRQLGTDSAALCREILDQVGRTTCHTGSEPTSIGTSSPATSWRFLTRPESTEGCGGTADSALMREDHPRQEQQNRSGSSRCCTLRYIAPEYTEIPHRYARGRHLQLGANLRPVAHRQNPRAYRPAAARRTLAWTPGSYPSPRSCSTSSDDPRSPKGGGRTASPSTDLDSSRVQRGTCGARVAICRQVVTPCRKSPSKTLPTTILFSTNSWRSKSTRRELAHLRPDVATRLAEAMSST